MCEDTHASSPCLRLAALGGAALGRPRRRAPLAGAPGRRAPPVRTPRRPACSLRAGPQCTEGSDTMTRGVARFLNAGAARRSGPARPDPTDHSAAYTDKRSR